MLKDDPILKALLQLLLVQQQDILHMKAHLTAMEQVLVERFGPDAGRRFYEDAAKLQDSSVFGGSRATIAAIERLIVKTFPDTGTEH